MVDGEKLRNRSHAIEYIITKALRPRVKKALILAGGSPVRLGSAAHKVPRGMLLVNGTPILEAAIRNLVKSGVQEIIISLGEAGEQIQQYFGKGQNFGVNIRYLRQSGKNGTALALTEAEPLLNNEPFILWYADVIANINLNDFIHFHSQHDGIISLALTSVEDISPWGVVRLQGSRIVNFTEKPNPRERSHVISSGIFICNTSVFEAIPAGARRLEQDVFPNLAAQDALYGYLFAGEWYDIGSPESYALARKEFESEERRVNAKNYSG